MTQRERQILEWIKADPMISQEQLAQLAGITRSSVAVHISNLTKKGYLAGKGYVVRDGAYIAVVGGVNVDIGGRSFSPLVAKDSNPGRVTVGLGGVGRNIAHNLSLLGTDVTFLTALGDDLYAQQVRASCTDLGIDLSHALTMPGGATPTYLYLSDSDGDMALAVADMAICDEITPAYLTSQLPVLNHAQLIVADTNIPVESLAFLADRCTPPLFIDPVSTKKAAKLSPVLSRIHTIKPNRLEAELLTGITIHDEESLKEAAAALLRAGVKRVFLSLGKDGVLAADENEMLRLPICPATVKNATGAGDAFMAALAWAWVNERGLAHSAQAAAAAAALAAESEETINPALSAEAIRRKLTETGPDDSPEELF